MKNFLNYFKPLALLLKFGACLLFIMCAFSVSLFAQDGGADAPTFFEKASDFLKNYAWLIAGIWELVTRGVPGWEENSLLRFIGGILDVLIPNRKEGGGLVTTYETGVMGQLSNSNPFPNALSWVLHCLPFILSFAMIVHGYYTGGLFSQRVPAYLLLGVAFVIQYFLLKRKVAQVAGNYKNQPYK